MARDLVICEPPIPSSAEPRLFFRKAALSSASLLVLIRVLSSSTSVMRRLEALFITPGQNNVAGVLGGGGFEWRTRKGVSWFGAAEAIGMSDSGTVVSARGGIRVAF